MARDYQFNTGPETATLPTATDPVVAADIMTKGYADAHYQIMTIAETQMTLANNQAATNITSMVTDHNTYRSVTYEYTVERRSAAAGYRQRGEIIAEYEAFAGTWSLVDNVKKGSSGPTTGVTFTIDTATGQVKYATDDLSSQTVGKLRWRCIGAFLKET